VEAFRVGWAGRMGSLSWPADGAAGDVTQLLALTVSVRDILEVAYRGRRCIFNFQSSLTEYQLNS